MNERKAREVVLVVDDSPETLRMLTDALDQAGMTVMVALDGSAAMKVVEQITPDIILLDAVMPGFDGFEACRRLKSEPALSHVPVVFMTGLSETEHIVRGLEAGGVDYVTKPIVIEEMLARIRVHLANARLIRRAADRAHLARTTQGLQAHLARGRSPVVAQQGQDQPRHRPDPGSEPADDRQAPGADLRQARRREPDGRCGDGGEDEPGAGGLTRITSRPGQAKREPGPIRRDAHKVMQRDSGLH